MGGEFLSICICTVGPGVSIPYELMGGEFVGLIFRLEEGVEERCQLSVQLSFVHVPCECVCVCERERERERVRVFFCFFFFAFWFFVFGSLYVCGLV